MKKLIFTIVQIIMYLFLFISAFTPFTINYSPFDLLILTISEPYITYILSSISLVLVIFSILYKFKIEYPKGSIVIFYSIYFIYLFLWLFSFIRENGLNLTIVVVIPTLAHLLYFWIILKHRNRRLLFQSICLSFSIFPILAFLLDGYLDYGAYLYSSAFLGVLILNIIENLIEL